MKRSYKSRADKTPPSQDECGVWLDPAQLRAKKQRKLVQPISKLLDPLARSGGYTGAVALNFTQTKMEMPATKQSKISSFFLPQCKKGGDAEDCSSLLPSSSTPLPEASAGTKRKRETKFEKPLELGKLSGCSSIIAAQELEAVGESLSGEVCYADKEQRFLHLIYGYQSEESEPAGKRKPSEGFNIKSVTDSEKDSSKGKVHGWITAEGPESLSRDQTQQYSHETLQMHSSIYEENSDGSSTSVSPEDIHTQELSKDCVTMNSAALLTLRPATEIQNTTKCFKPYKKREQFEQRCQWSPVKRADKENSRPSSPRHRTALSPDKQYVCSSPAKHSSCSNRKLHRTPKKSVIETQENNDDDDDDPFSMLFTQDSEGFQVIAHRSTPSRCALKDQTNSCDARVRLFVPSSRSQEMEENPDLDILFTQDSQGNMVIKH